MRRKHLARLLSLVAEPSNRDTAQRGIQRTMLAIEVATAQPVADEAGAHPHTWLRIYSDKLLLHRVLPPMPLCGNAQPVPATCARILLTAHWELQR